MHSSPKTKNLMILPVILKDRITDDAAQEGVRRQLDILTAEHKVDQLEQGFDAVVVNAGHFPGCFYTDAQQQQSRHRAGLAAMTRQSPDHPFAQIDFPSMEPARSDKFDKAVKAESGFPKWAKHEKAILAQVKENMVKRAQARPTVYMMFFLPNGKPAYGMGVAKGCCGSQAKRTLTAINETVESLKSEATVLSPIDFSADMAKSLERIQSEVVMVQEGTFVEKAFGNPSASHYGTVSPTTGGKDSFSEHLLSAEEQRAAEITPNTD